MSTLYELTGEYLALSDMLLDEEVDEQTVLDTLEGVKGEIEIKAEGYVKVLRSIEAQQKIYEAEADEFAKKAKLAKNNAARLEKALLDAMIQMDIPEIDTKLFKLKVAGKGGKPAVEVDEDIENIPDQFIRVKREPDKTKIAEYLATLPEGVECPFARFLPKGKKLSIK